MPAVKCLDGVLARAIVELLPKGSGSGDREVEALPSEIDREAQTPVGVWIANHGLVFFVDNSIVVAIHINQVAGLRVGLCHTVACCLPIINLLLVLENTGCLIAPEVTDGITNLCPVELGGVDGSNSSFIAVDDAL